MTEQKQMLKRRLECISEHLNVIWVAYIVLTMYLEGNRCWVPLLGAAYAFRVTYEREGLVDKEETPALYDHL